MSQAIFSCPNLPILQNRVYDSLEEARRAPTGDLAICLQDDFAWNDRFDPGLMKYDDHYDNSVPSDRFNAYYDQIADHLASSLDLSRGPVVDVGCGKGTFLKRMAARYEFSGIGIDPSYEGPKQVGNLQFIAEEFDKRYIKSVPSLVLCRHTLEHIPDPTSFLKSVLDELPESAEVPIFCEVPDLNWILQNRTWWDFCYEHVNYFSSTSFARCMRNAGCSSVSVRPAFSGQYLWGEGVVGSSASNPESEPAVEASLAIDDMTSYVDEAIARMKEQSQDRKLVIWGMATKGVIYALHAAKAGLHIDCGVDINPAKQGKFAPVSGLKICAPDALLKHEKYAVVCINPNYDSEIRAELKRLELDFVLLEP